MLRIFSIFDSKVGAYMQPFFPRTTLEGMRMVEEAINGNNADSLLSKHPDDFILFELGTFNELDGTLANSPLNLGTCLQFVKRNA